jgi:hypothetical protein
VHLLKHTVHTKSICSTNTCQSYEKVTNSKILVNKQMQIIFHTVFQTKSTKNVITTNYIHNLTISEQIVQISENFLSNIYNNKLYKYVLIFLET